MSEHPAAHLTDGEIIALPDGTGDVRAGLHVESCGECRERVAQWREAREALSGARAGLIAESSKSCPDMEELASYAAGRDDDGVASHVAGCDRCSGIVREALEGREEDPAGTPMMLRSSTAEWRRRMAAQFASGGRRRPRYSVYAAAAVLVAMAAGSALWWKHRQSSDPAVLLAKAYTAARPFEFRLPDAGYEAIRQQRGGASTFDRPEALDSAVAVIRRELSGHPDSAGVVALKGRAELLERNYESAIQSLTRATASGDANPDALTDLATAYAVRGEAESRNMDYGHATELFLQSLRKRPGDQRTLFNLALTYEKLWLVDEAIETWEKVLAGHPAEGWRKEAETHLAAMKKIREEKKRADGRILHDPSQFLAEYSGKAFDPLPWWDVIWMEWLPKAARDKAAADASRVIAAGFTKFGEWSLQEVVDAPGSAGKQAGLELLARAMIANRKGRSGDALAPAREAEEKLRAAGLRGAAALARSELVYSTRVAGHGRACMDASGKLLESTGTKYGWIEGNAHLERAACLMAVGDFGTARTEIERAGGQLARAGLWPVALRSEQFITSLDGNSGNYGPVWDAAPKGLKQYWTTAASPYRAQTFQHVLQLASTGLGWRECAVVLFGAEIRTDHSIGNAEMEALNRSSLAQMLQQMGDYRGAMRELDEVDALVNREGNRVMAETLRWTTSLRRVEAEIASGSNQDPLPELDRLSASAGEKPIMQRITLEQTRGLALLAQGDAHGAAEAFRRAIDLDQEQVASAQSWVVRMPMLEAAAPAYRNLTQLGLAEDPVRALAVWRRFRPVSRASTRTITMAMLPKGIVVWSSQADKVTARWVETDPTKLRKASGDLLALCASPTSSAEEIRRLGNLLYRALLNPELRGLAGGDVLLATDSWLAEIPFPALSDDSGLYLSSRFHFVEGYGPEGKLRKESARADWKALVVTAPKAVAPGQSPLPVLRAAEQEAIEVSARFPGTSIQREGTVQWLTSNAPGANLFHFSGHGWANGGNGALVLPPGPDGGARFVTSQNLAGQDWSRCQLAVLSACLTGAGEMRGAVNNQSLVQALLSAGARRVIAARWSIDSEATRILMDRFYARLVSGKSVAEALSGAAAEVAAIPNWSHPYYWAGFDVFGSV